MVHRLQQWVWSWVWKSSYHPFSFPCQVGLNEAMKRIGTCMIWASIVETPKNGGGFDMGVIAVEGEGVYISGPKEREVIESDTRVEPLPTNDRSPARPKLAVNTSVIQSPRPVPATNADSLARLLSDRGLSGAIESPHLPVTPPLVKKVHGWYDQLENHSVASGSPIGFRSNRGSVTPFSTTDTNHHPPQSPAFSQASQRHDRIERPVSTAYSQSTDRSVSRACRPEGDRFPGGQLPELTWATDAVNSNTLPHLGEVSSGFHDILPGSRQPPLDGASVVGEWQYPTAALADSRNWGTGLPNTPYAYPYSTSTATDANQRHQQNLCESSR